jgi:hypothetical protein
LIDADQPVGADFLRFARRKRLMNLWGASSMMQGAKIKEIVQLGDREAGS